MDKELELESRETEEEEEAGFPSSKDSEMGGGLQPSLR